MQEQWLKWREAGHVGIDEYVSWVEELVSAGNDPDGLYASWRVMPSRETLLKRALSGEIVSVGTGSQPLLALFYGLYEVLNGRRCFIASSMQIDTVYMRALLKKITTLGKLSIRVMGTILEGGKVYLGDCENIQLAFVDYFQLLAVYKKNRDLFERMVQSLFLLEIDLTLYATRLVVFDHGIERAAGLIYKTSGSIPEMWQERNEHLDGPRVWDELTNIRLGGCYSYADAYSVSEMRTLMPRRFPRRFKVESGSGYGSFTYRTSQERTSALVNDVMKCEGNALVVCCTEQLRQELMEEFKRSGQPCTVTSRSADILTFFTPSTTQGGKKKVMVMRGVPSTLFMPAVPLCRGAVFMAEHALTHCMHVKIFALAKGLFEHVQEPRLYYSLEDQLFMLYADRGGFAKLFDLIDFTERYDPWRQIRRVLARSMANRLHRLRVKSLDENTPLITVVLNANQSYASARERKVTSKLDAPCFCGSGLPFKECHGKPRS